MKPVVLAFLGFLCISLQAQTTKNYIEYDEVIANPERGLQKYSITDGNYSSTSDYSNLSESELTGWRTSTDKVTVIFRYFLMDDFLTQDINATYLANIQNDFDIIRNAGLKCIVRFSYSNGITSDPQQPSLNQIFAHLGQIAPILETNKDIIVTHQAGLLGTWGEWYYTRSSEFGDEGSISAAQWDARKQLVDSMISSTPVSIPIQVRYAEIKRQISGTTPLNETTAYTGMSSARIGFFNDAFLNNWGDQGTYSVSSANENPVGTVDYSFISNETKYVPMTGETNGLNAPRTDGSNAVFEMDSTNWSMLNRDYYTQNWDNWISDGLYDDILKGLGYRFVLESSTFERNGDELDISIQLRNEGYARPYKERRLYLVLENGDTSDTTMFLLPDDVRTWEDQVVVNETISTDQLSDGTYHVYLFLPDLSSGLMSRPEYSIRFANENVWDAVTGMNDLDQMVVVSTITGSGVQIVSDGEMQIYPNPGSGMVTVEIDGNTAVTGVVVMEVGGKVLLDTVNPELGNSGERRSFTIDISGYGPGEYLVKVITAGGECVRVFVKE